MASVELSRKESATGHGGWWQRPLLFLAQRLLFAASVMLVIIWLSFFGLDMARGKALVPAAADAIPKTGHYIGRLLQADLGLSNAYISTYFPRPITEFLPDVLGKSFGLLGLSLLFATLIGVLLGIISARRQTGKQSFTILVASIIGTSTPSFFLALLLQMLIIRWTQWAGKTVLPTGGFGWDDHLVLPLLVLAARPIAQITRITYISVTQVLAQDFVRTARSKGLGPIRVMWRHVLRNTAVPILTTIGLSLRFALSSLPVVEFFFGWPGIGFFLLKAISQQDDNLTIALLLSLGLFFILINFILEAAYRLIDPRLRSLPEHIASGERQTIKAAIKELWEAMRSRGWVRREWRFMLNLRSLIPNFRFWRRKSPSALSRQQRQSWLRHTLGNRPLMLGSLLVGTLLFIFLFGPVIAPHSPYTTSSLEIVDGEYYAPPFAPDDVYPWGTDVFGRDIASLILAGAQQTLLLAAAVVVVRLVIGFVLGAAAGWLNGSWLDKAILSLAELLAAFPTLLFAMILILALGIRGGLRPFLIALSVVGWGEIMQFVRSQVIAIRPKPFIESAVAVGSTTTRIIMHHILPNLLSALISLAALEMGAVLMLLGELGFLSIFIGGGAFAELQYFAPSVHYSDVPEWGSLLSNIREYARTYPWVAIYPSLAFFFAILGFNLFGEGIRQLVEGMGGRFTRLFNRYTLLAAILFIIGVGWVRENTGAIAFYKRQAAQFKGQNSLVHVQFLTEPALNGRSLGTPGHMEAANYIAHQFEQLGLQAAGDEFSYFQNRFREFEQLTAVPQLSLSDGEPPLLYRQDFAEFIGQRGNLGDVSGPIHLLTWSQLTELPGGFGFGVRRPAIEDVSFEGEILLLMAPEHAPLFTNVPRLGTLVVTDNETFLRKRHTLSGISPIFNLAETNQSFGAERPEFWIDAETADRLLQNTDYTVSELRRQIQLLEQDAILEVTTNLTATLNITGTLQDRHEVVNVIGHLPGLSEAGLASQMIVVMAQFDSPPLSPDGAFYPAANDNASGIAVMLEIIRTMQESGYQPYKTLLFVAYSGEGQEGGSFSNPAEVAKFLEAKYGFTTAFEIEAVVDIRGVGAGNDTLQIKAGDSLRLTELMERAGKHMNVSTERISEAVDLSILFAEEGVVEKQVAPRVGVQWQNWQELARTPDDTLMTITTEKLENAGRTLTLALMIIGREIQY